LFSVQDQTIRLRITNFEQPTHFHFTLVNVVGLTFVVALEIFFV